MHIFGATRVLKGMNHRHKREKLSNNSITENYSGAGILQNAHTPSLQEQVVQQSVTSLMYQEVLVNIPLSGTYFSV